jgi:putative ABC transport system ATP-binding protein
MTASATATAAADPVATAHIGDRRTRTVRATVRRGLELSPEIIKGGRITLALGLVSTLGRVVVPLAVQQTVDAGIQADGGPDVRRVAIFVAGAAVAVVVTAVTAYVVNVRLFKATEAGLMSLRVKAFRHVHDLSVLTQNAERRGSMVSRVTSDVDTISQFVQFGGLQLLLSIGQLLVATVLMAIYSPLLTALVWLCFAPMIVGARFFQRKVSAAYQLVRERVADVLGAVSEAVVGAATVRAYAIEGRTQQRVDVAVQAHRRAAVSAQTRVALTFSLGVLSSGLTTAVVVVAGIWLGAHGRISLGELLAFLFLVQLFTSPVQTATDVLNELQNAVAGWRRVIAVVETPADVADPGDNGRRLPRGPITVRFEHVGYAYPGGAPVLHDIDLTLDPSTRVAVVGETGSGKTTFAKLLTRLMDPVEGRVLIDGVDLREIAFSSLRDRVVLVPQEGFLFEGSVLDNLRFSRPDASVRQVRLALTELGLLDWADGLPHGLDTAVGQRGESLSAGERQLVALTRAYLADPDLLVLDEATSSVDPATEVRIQRALDSLTRGRTALAIAHRLSTAEAADEVLVMDAGRLVERGPSSVLARAGGRYAELHASWTAQLRSD